MKDLIWLDAGRAGRRAKYLGTPGKPGDLAKQLATTAQFLKEQKLIDRDPSIDEFQEAVDGECASKAGG